MTTLGNEVVSLICLRGIETGWCKNILLNTMCEIKQNYKLTFYIQNTGKDNRWNIN